MSITLTPAADGGFQEALLGHVTTVCVITCRDPDGRPIGMTATAFAVASQDPARVVVCVNSESRTCEAIRERGSFGINFLDDDAQEVSSYCARPGANKELVSTWLVTADSGTSPLLRNARGFLDCTVETEVEAGLGAVLIGRPTACGTHADPAGPLLFSGGRYYQVGGELA